jgi:hypothetical protein
VYGTISGEGFKASAEAMRDGGIDFGSAALASKKKPEPVVKDKKDEKPEQPAAKPAVSAKAPEKQDTKVKPAKVKPEPPVEAEVRESCTRISVTDSHSQRPRPRPPILMARSVEVSHPPRLLLRKQRPSQRPRLDHQARRHDMKNKQPWRP